MKNYLTEIIRIARPVHWIKNFAIFAALVFTGHLFDKLLFLKVVYAFIAFSFATSATYVFNDILDVNLDKLHPIKKNRPIASGKLSIKSAFLELTILSSISLYLASGINSLFFFAVAGYLFIQFCYSLGLKNYPIIDIIIIAFGFIIRIYAGAFVINAHLSVWFLLCVISTALFLASGKRRAELNILETVGVTRKSLIKYKRELLNSYVTMFGNASWMSWALFTFFESPPVSVPVWIFLAELSKTTAINKLLMITIPVSIFGIMRYQSLIFEGKSEAPEKLLLSDKALITSVFIWLSIIIWVLYGGVAIFPRINP